MTLPRGRHVAINNISVFNTAFIQLLVYSALDCMLSSKAATVDVLRRAVENGTTCMRRTFPHLQMLLGCYKNGSWTFLLIC